MAKVISVLAGPDDPIYNGKFVVSSHRVSIPEQAVAAAPAKAPPKADPIEANRPTSASNQPRPRSPLRSLSQPRSKGPGRYLQKDR